MPLPEIPYDEWFHKPHPHDSMPIAKDEPLEPCEVSNVPEGGGTTRKDQLKDVTVHEKMYKIATAKYNPFAIGGSESIHDFGGGSELVK